MMPLSAEMMRRLWSRHKVYPTPGQNNLPGPVITNPIFSGNKMGGLDSQRMISIQVPHGTLIEISVDSIAPEEGGKYTGYWALKNAAGVHFGIGPYKNPIYVEINGKIRRPPQLARRY